LNPFLSFNAETNVPKQNGKIFKMNTNNARPSFISGKARGKQGRGLAAASLGSSENFDNCF